MVGDLHLSTLTVRSFHDVKVLISCRDALFTAPRSIDHQCWLCSVDQHRNHPPIAFHFTFHYADVDCPAFYRMCTRTLSLSLRLVCYMGFVLPR